MYFLRGFCIPFLFIIPWAIVALIASIVIITLFVIAHILKKIEKFNEWLAVFVGFFFVCLFCGFMSSLICDGGVVNSFVYSIFGYLEPFFDFLNELYPGLLFHFIS